MLPRVARSGKERVDEGNGHRESGQRPEQAVGPEKAELDPVRAEGDERGEEDAAGARVGRRLPLSRRCSGIVIGSPSHADRPKSASAHEAMKA